MVDAAPMSANSTPIAAPHARRGDLPQTILVWAAALLVTGVFAWILSDLVRHGWSGLTWEFLTTHPQKSGRRGGIFPILVSTLLILGVCMAVSLPLGLGSAMFLSEYTSADGFFGRFVRRSLDVLAGVPSIVFGLFGNAVFCNLFGMGFSILAGGLTLACMVLPILIRATEEGFRSVPNEYRLGAAALGMSRATTLFTVLLPVAAPGLVVGMVLGFGRAIAETAALLFTSGYVDRMPESLLDSGRKLSIHIFELSMNIPGGNANAYSSALVLVTLLLIINLTASWLAEHGLKRRVLRF